ncbi:MAG: hypothetical protein Kow0069_32970 [Promethearchaeota archaeon]
MGNKREGETPASTDALKQRLLGVLERAKGQLARSRRGEAANPLLLEFFRELKGVAADGDLDGALDLFADGRRVLATKLDLLEAYLTMQDRFQTALVRLGSQTGVWERAYEGLFKQHVLKPLDLPALSPSFVGRCLGLINRRRRRLPPLSTPEHDPRPIDAEISASSINFEEDVDRFVEFARGKLPAELLDLLTEGAEDLENVYQNLSFLLHAVQEGLLRLKKKENATFVYPDGD